jgi:DNA repair exonuclease SbcCD ATPase subunit
VKTDTNGGIIDIICPCCARGLSDEEVKVFSKRMDELKDVERSEIIKVDQTIEKEKNLYKRWRDIVASGFNTWHERIRCNNEIRDIENVLVQKKEEKNALKADLKRIEHEMECLKNESENLSNLLNEAVRFRYIAERIKDRHFSIKQAKSRYCSHNGDERDLKQVEADYLELMHKKDKLTEENTKLNKQVTSLNLRISNAASAVSQAEKEAREKEALYKEIQEAASRRNILEERSGALTEEEKKVNLILYMLLAMTSL